MNEDCKHRLEITINEYNQITKSYRCMNPQCKYYDNIVYEETEQLNGQKSVIIDNKCEECKNYSKENK